METSTHGRYNIKSNIANMYDSKIVNSTNFNRLLAQQDSLAFNQDGILLPGDSLVSYQARITDDASRLAVLHSLELNTTRFGSLFLKIPSRDTTLLDAGCGAGGSGILIHQTYGCNVEGFTLSPQQAKFGNASAEKYGCAKYVKFAVDDMTHLTKPDNYFDHIWASGSTEHVSSLNTLFKEFARVAKNNARLVIIAWCANDAAVKKSVDEHYLTDINTADSYVSSAAKFGWHDSYHLDLTAQWTPYWQLRSYPNECTGAERFMTPGAVSNKLQYFMFCFDLSK